MKLFADGADFDGIVEAAKDFSITGFTTNPTLMAKAGVVYYDEFARKTISYLKTMRPDTCLSLEVFADDHDGMVEQARKIASWGRESDYNVYVKIPIMFTNGKYTYDVIKQLNSEGIKLNVTAIMTKRQVIKTMMCLNSDISTIISIFAGRIADTGADAKEMFWDVGAYRRLCRNAGLSQNVEFLWASPREAYNYVDAKDADADIITMTPDLIKKVKGFGKDLELFSLETCQMFYTDAVKSGFKI